MKKFKRFKRKATNYLFDHPILKNGLDYGYALIMCAVSAFVFGFGFSCFITPYSSEDLTIITGGVSGISQVVNLIFNMCGIIPEGNIIQSVSYFVINVPLLIFAFKFIGPRFSILTVVNVGLTSLFMTLLQKTHTVQVISEYLRDETISRALFGGVCTGISSGIAFKGFFSAGGLDIVSYAISLRKGANTGKYGIILNVFVVTSYTLINIFNSLSKGEEWAIYITGLLFSAVYLVISAVIIDMINVRNKKSSIEIITNKEHMSDVLIANFPHSVTIINGRGGYTHQERYVMRMVVSSQEIKKVVRVISSYDPNAFIEVTHLQQVFGNFFVKPVE